MASIESISAEEIKRKSMAELKNDIMALDKESFLRLYPLFREDKRKNTALLLERKRKELQKEEKERERIEGMLLYEKALWEKGCHFVAGIDEVGRGPLAGPVVSASVIMKPDSRIFYVNDSKKVTPKLRESLFDQILKEAVEVKVTAVNNKIIDEINIYEATKLSMEECIRKMRQKPDHILIDAIKLERVFIPQTSIIKGDSKSYSIACASIIAKVFRDRLMDTYDRKYPEYGFSRHKGYPTKEHIEAIRKYGYLDIHRRTFQVKF